MGQHGFVFSNALSLLVTLLYMHLSLLIAIKCRACTMNTTNQYSLQDDRLAPGHVS